MINTVDILVEIGKMEEDNIFGPMEIFIKENFVKICDKEKDKCHGLMEVFIRDNGKEVYLMEKVLNIIIKLGIFKVNGEKARAGYFEDNVMISEEKQR